MGNKDLAIEVENLSKIYRIGLKDEMHDSLLGGAIGFIKSPLKNYRKYRSLYKFDDLLANSEAVAEGIIWALNNVSFDVKMGEVLGIIGRNGAGKTTLLKILSRITNPTSGVATIRGRISSLLEVGTGFHPELTGRENIYLNGTILGMKKKEVDQKFDEIVEFSGVEKFIDTPVKRYSNGMKVRIAFSVAAHLEPEILIIDEVLAVGDVRFQKKCLKKMEDVSSQGRTVLFVSHSMPAVTRLCPRALLLDQGRIIEDGPSEEVVGAYMTSESGIKAERVWPDSRNAPGNRVARLRAVRAKTKDEHVKEFFDIRQPIGIEMEFEVIKPGHVLLPHFHFFNEEGIHAFMTIDQDSDWRKRSRPVGYYKSIAWIPGNFLAEGMLYATPALVTMNPVDSQFYERDAIAFQVIDNQQGNSARGDWANKVRGVVRPLLKWETKYSVNKDN
jgi:lipopolysaccharide transport system ATP-binding protein